jgi:predicted nuclease of restriction endonuclease-like (RecB) superfamily
VIVEEEQRGKGRADYGSRLICELSTRLRNDFRRGFDQSNLLHMRQFYLTFKNQDALRLELTWTHYRLLLRQENEYARDFYLNECINSRWSTRELERQMNSLLYERLALSRDKQKVLEMAQKGQIIEKPEDLIKDPFVLEFVGLGEKSGIDESELEARLIRHLKHFLLELGRGFAFVGKQKRIGVGDDHYYVDLVFYNYLLKCFVLIDLKIGKLTPQDIGQMDFYVRYYEKEVRRKGDNPTIGLILCADKNSAMAKYTLLKGSKRIFASKYRLVMPSEKELKEEMERQRLATGPEEKA